MKKVSIIIPTYNQESYIKETLDSVLAQSYENWECIVVDDGSNDNTQDIVLKYCEKDDRFRYLKQENQGPSAARNNGISNSSGEYILPLDSDDLIDKNYIKEAAEILSASPEIKVVYCLAEFFGDINASWELLEYEYDKMLFGNMIFCSAMYRRADYDKTEGYNSNMRDGFEDWDFWLSFIKKEDIVFRIPKVYFYYRIKNNSRNTNANDEGRVEKLYKQIYENHKELYGGIINPIFGEHKIKNLEKEIELMKLSKFWKLRDFYMKIKGGLIK